jgi:hypothetical protein
MHFFTYSTSAWRSSTASLAVHACGICRCYIALLCLLGRWCQRSAATPDSWPPAHLVTCQVLHDLRETVETGSNGDLCCCSPPARRRGRSAYAISLLALGDSGYENCMEE